ncbi:mucin-2-like [Dorcoceras hygrometricum]|uniref:Mucin-2-like n=1 Tax=Dorcoceras hygrometricum TaxID=472368 RepID=A0A2Z7AGT4_9LAMI|nr:mucin-2-like [Dorcoceras hygrometricum]
MASSLISRSHHIDFDSIFCFDDVEIVQMFESLVTTGLMEFLGCPAIFHENALTEFFANGSVRDDMVVSTIGGIAVEISESIFAAAFGLPTEGLTDLSEVPRNFLSDAQSLFSASEKEVSISCLKKEIKMQYRLLSDILAKSLFVKAGSFDAVTRDRFLLMKAITFDNIPGLELGDSKAFPAPRILNEKPVHRIVLVNENVGVEEVGEAPRAKKTPEPDAAQGGLVKTWFDKAFDEEFELANSERQDTEEEIVVGFDKGTSAGDQPPAFKNWADGTNDDESLSIEEHQARIPFHASLPSTLAPPITQIRFGQRIEFRDVDAYTPDLPRIDISDKGKGILVEDDFQGHPARETFSLICADIEFLIALREKVIEEVSIFVSSFSLRKLASLQSEDIFAKEGQLLSWAETDSSFVAIQRRQFIIAKYRELLLRKFIDARRKNFISGTPTSAIDLKVLNILSAAHTFALKYLLRNMKAHQLEWTRPSSSSLFEGPIIDQGSLFPVTHRSISSPANSNHWEALPQRPYIDDLAPICIFVEPVQDIAKYRELLLRKFIDARRKNFISGTPTSAIDLKVLNLLSAAHTFALKDLLRNMKAHQLEWTRPTSSSLFEGPIIDQGSLFPVTHRSISSPANSNHWEALPQRPYIDDLAPICIFVEPVQDIDSRPSLSRTLRVIWAQICMEAIRFSTLGRLRPVCRELVVYNLGVERIPDYLLANFEKGVHTDCFVGYFDDSCVQPSIQTSSGIESSSSSASAVYRSPSPIPQQVNSPDFEPVAPTDDQEDTHTSLPTASVDFVSLLDALQASLCQRMDDANNDILSRLNSTERSVQTSLGHQTDYLRRLIDSAQHAGQTQDDIQLLRLNELRKLVMAIDIKVGTNSLDVRNKFSSLDAKFRSFDDQIATLRNDQLEFQTKIAADILGLSTQISEIADFIRSGDAKKGESGSSSRPPPVRVERRPLPTPQSPRDVAGGSSAVRIPTFPRTTGTFAERVEQARRHTLESGQIISVEEAAERIRQADIQESDRLQRERYRARREKRSSSSKRRRGF